MSNFIGLWIPIIALTCLLASAPSNAAALHLATMVQRIDATIGNDGVFVKRVHTEVTVQTAAAAAGLSHFPVSWTGNQTLKIVKAYTRKSDGRIIQTNPADLVMQNGLVGAAASFGDIKTEQLALRTLALGW